MDEKTVFADGTELDVVIIDATSTGDGCAIEAVIATGPHKGDLIELHSPGLDLDPVDLLGLAGTVSIVDGSPRLAL